MLLLYHGKLHGRSPEHTALAVNQGKIVAVGSDTEVLHLDASDADRIDLGGRYVLPGMTDSHIHLELYGASLNKVNCATPTLQDCLGRVKARSGELPAGKWILGHGWNQNQWSGRFGTAHDLDSVAPLQPVFLTDISLHSAWVNSRALDLAGINAATADPAGGAIQRDDRGNPTGILLENAVQLVESIIPPITVEERKHDLLVAQDKLLRFGITSAHDFDRIPCFSALQQLDAEGELILRVFKSLPVDHLAEAIALGLKTGFGSPHLRVGPVKMFADGALGPQTAAMLSPYEGNQDNLGKLLLTAEEIFETGMRAARSGLSLAIHAIGDRATHETLKGFAQLREYEKQFGFPALQHRVEHLQLLSPHELAQASHYGICASMQPVHLYMDKRTADRHWGNRSRYAYAMASLRAHNTALVFGSDAPVENPNPFWGIHAAVTRCAQGSVDSWYAEECIDLADAFAAYTWEPARQAGLAQKLGELKTGQLADLVVLDQNPYQLDPDEIYSIKPVMVMVDGIWVHRTY